MSAIVLFLAAVSLLPAATALSGSSSTVAVLYGSAIALCTLSSEHPIQQIQCWRDGELLPPLAASASFDFIAGGRDTLCGVLSGGSSLICWDVDFNPKTLDTRNWGTLTSLVVGDTQVCTLRNTAETGNAICWKGDQVPPVELRFRMISSGLKFSCGVLQENGQVLCWGDDQFAPPVQSVFEGKSMASIQVGALHACGFNISGFVVCGGNCQNDECDVPENSPYQYRSLALGASHTCGLTRLNHTVVCWGVNGTYSSAVVAGISFETITAGVDFTCGLSTADFSIMCWGRGWLDQYGNTLPLQPTLPGPCVDSICPCNIYPNSPALCGGSGHVCAECEVIPHKMENK